MEKTFKFAGVSTRNGVVKARFANDMMRVKVLAKTGSSDIDLIELETAMTKADAIALLLKINFDNGNATIRAALEDGLEKRTVAVKAVKVPKATAVNAPKAKKGPSMDAIKAKVAAAKKAPVSTKSKAQIEAELANLEDAPF